MHWVHDGGLTISARQFIAEKIRPLSLPTARSRGRPILYQEKTMQALVYSALREVTMQERPEPIPAPDEVLLKVRGTGICGSDMVGFLGLSPRRQPGLVLGHEAVATVARMPQTKPVNGGEWPFPRGSVWSSIPSCLAASATPVSRGASISAPPGA